MWKALKRFSASDTGPLYLTLVALSVVLVLSLLQIDPGMGPKTTISRLYNDKLITTALILIIAAGLLKLHHDKPEERRSNCLVFAGMLWGLGLASALAFDPVMFLLLSGAANALYRPNAKDGN